MEPCTRHSAKQTLSVAPADGGFLSAALRVMLVEERSRWSEANIHRLRLVYRVRRWLRRIDGDRQSCVQCRESRASSARELKPRQLIIRVMPYEYDRLMCV